MFYRISYSSFKPHCQEEEGGGGSCQIAFLPPESGEKGKPDFLSALRMSSAKILI